MGQEDVNVTASTREPCGLVLATLCFGKCYTEIMENQVKTK